jgi:hypothetical protein
VSIESHGRLLAGARQAVDKLRGKREGWSLKEALLEAEAVQALVDFALELAGTEKPPPPVFVGGGNAPLHIPEPPPRLRPPTQGRVWSKDVRPGPHDVLTWEEAMRVPWLNGVTEYEPK